MQVDHEQLLSLSQDLWQTHLGLNIDVASGTAEAGEGKTLASCIHVSGPFQGTILFECSESVVRHAAAMMFASDGESASQEDLNDALQELAGMIGKKMRRLLPDTAKLSRPAIVMDEANRMEGMEGLSDLKLNCEGRPVRIALMRKETEPEPATA